MQTKLGPQEVALFCENMGMMYQAGIQTDEAVRLIAADSGGGALQQVLQDVIAKMDDGLTLPNAIAKVGAFPQHAVMMMEIAERSGRLEPTMFALGDYFMNQKRFQDRMRSALLYPMILLVLMTLVLLVLTIQVLPIFSNVYNNMAGQISSASLSYASAAQTVSYVAIIVVLVIALVFLVGSCLAYFGKSTTTVTRLFDTLPITAGVSYTSSLSRAVTALATFTASGIDPESALSSIVSEIGNKKLRSRIEACVEHVREGDSFAQAAFDEQLLEPLYGRMLINSERSGTFDETINYLADVISEDAERETDRLISSIEPICAAFLTISVALSLVAMIIPLIGIIGALG